MRAAVTAILVAAHLLACSLVGLMGWLAIWWASNDLVGPLALAVFLLAIAMSALLLAGRWRGALIVFALEVCAGVPVLLLGLEESDRSDHWLYLLAVGIGLAGATALAIARPLSTQLRRSRTVPG